MASAQHILAAVLACTMLLANTACACAMPEPAESETNPHAHHQTGDEQSGAALCAHDDCDNCELLDAAPKPERDTKLTGPKTDLDDDAMWLAAVAGIQPATSAAARASPPLYRAPQIPQTPVRLADLLLE